MNSNELIPIEPIPVNIEPDKPKELTLEDLPLLLPQQQAMFNHIIDGDNYTDAYRKAGYKSDYPRQASFVLVTRNPLKAHLDYFYQQMAKRITPEYITARLNDIVDMTTNTNNSLGFNPETAIKAMQEVNKMQGNHKQTLQVNNIHASIEDIRKAKQEYIKDK